MRTAEQRRALWERDGRCCGICGAFVDLADMDLDHIKQQMLGGEDTDDNLRATHSSCNRRRGVLDRRKYGRQPIPRVPISVRMPDALYGRVAARARHDVRSVSAEIEWLLGLALDQLALGLPPAAPPGSGAA
jgi:hypothetical protein